MNPSRRSFRSTVRVLTGSVVGLSLLLGCIALLLKQPIFGAVPYRCGARADAARLRRHVAFLTREAAPRDSDHPESLERAAAYIEDQFARAGARVSDQAWNVRGRSEGG
jgi:hypothetical protein